MLLLCIFDDDANFPRAGHMLDFFDRKFLANSLAVTVLRV